MTDEAKADKARLAVVRQRRADAAKKKEEEAHEASMTAAQNLGLAMKKQKEAEIERDRAKAEVEKAVRERIKAHDASFEAFRREKEAKEAEKRLAERIKELESKQQKVQDALRTAAADPQDGFYKRVADIFSI